ncbi:hypothetical protein CEXT_95201 [Caerostris extrusa]|uniref:Uncharacterized protein n=1 Tax=Caerostris extrusa TaxID=172846 RepID=A0AAV4PHE9_CAEEX|nr:hypothetical protein CEXT_95201 [Caerostris extrusa]
MTNESPVILWPATQAIRHLADLTNGLDGQLQPWLPDIEPKLAVTAFWICMLGHVLRPSMWLDNSRGPVPITETLSAAVRLRCLKLDAVLKRRMARCRNG